MHRMVYRQVMNFICNPRLLKLILILFCHKVLSGNNQRRFTVKTSTYTPPTSPPPPVEETVTVATDTMMFTAVLCRNSSNITQPIPDVSTTVETFTIPSGDTTAMLTLAENLDFEATKEYDILLEVTDTARAQQGNITVRVRKTVALHYPCNVPNTIFLQGNRVRESRNSVFIYSQLAEEGR